MTSIPTNEQEKTGLQKNWITVLQAAVFDMQKKMNSIIALFDNPTLLDALNVDQFSEYFRS